jgi:hypothetical protein
MQQGGEILYLFFWKVQGAENRKKKDPEYREMLKVQ